MKYCFSMASNPQQRSRNFFTTFYFFSLRVSSIIIIKLLWKYEDIKIMHVKRVQYRRQAINVLVHFHVIVGGGATSKSIK